MIHQTAAEQATLKHNTNRNQGETHEQQPDIYNDNVFEHLDVGENLEKDSGYLESQATGTKEEGGKGEENNLLDLDPEDRQENEDKGERKDDGDMPPTDEGWGDVSIKVGGVSQVQGSGQEETS